MKYPYAEAFKIIAEIMEKGSDKDGADESWRTKPQGYHRMKAIRHLINADMIERSLILDDGEPHDENALTRIAMELSK